MLRIGLSRVRDEDMVRWSQEALMPRLIEEPISPVAGSLLEEIVRDGAHHGLVDLALDEAHRWLVQNEETFTEVVGERAPWWSPPAINERVTHRLHVEAVRLGRRHPRRPLPPRPRRPSTACSSSSPHDLLHDPATQERAERLKDRVLDHPQLVVTATSLWNAFRKALLGVARGPRGSGAQRGVDRAGAVRCPAASTDEALRAGSTGTPPTWPCSWSTGTATS